MSDWDWAALGAVLPDLIRGARNTVIFTAAAFPPALALGGVLAWGLAASNPRVRRIVFWIVEFIRTTPLLVQIYSLYFFLPSLGISLPAAIVGILALSVHYACYLSSVYLAGIRAVPKGQWEAAAALGLSRRLTFFKVILRQALVPVYPALANYLVILLKETPLLSAIGIVELMQAAKIAGSETFRYTEPFTAAAVIFLALTMASVVALRMVERRILAFRAG